MVKKRFPPEGTGIVPFPVDPYIAYDPQDIPGEWVAMPKTPFEEENGLPNSVAPISKQMPPRWKFMVVELPETWRNPKQWWMIVAIPSPEWSPAIPEPVLRGET